MALFAGCRPFFHIGMAAFAAFGMCEILAKAFNLATGCIFVTLGAILKCFAMSLVIENNTFFHLMSLQRMLSLQMLPDKVLP